jgi:hypothetical protein
VRCRRFGPGGPSADRLARSTKPKIRLHHSAADPRCCQPVGCRFRAVRNHPQAHLQEEHKGHHWRDMLYMPKKRISYSSRDGREPAEVAHRQGLARHGKARAAPTAELLEDVVRFPYMTSLEALSWQFPLAHHHFLEGIQERCPWQASRQALHQHHRPTRRCRAPDKDLPLGGKEVRRPLSLAGREYCSRRIPSLAGGGRLTREDSSPCLEEGAYGRRLKISSESR